MSNSANVVVTYVAQAGDTVAIKAPSDHLYLGVEARVDSVHKMTDGSQCAIVSYPTFVRDEKAHRSRWELLGDVPPTLLSLQTVGEGARLQFFVRSANLRFIAEVK